MRSVTLLLLLALPALARAQATPGVFEPTPLSGTGNRYRADKFINLEECDPAGNVLIDFRWNVAPAAGATFRSGVFRIWATNKKPTATDGGLAYCPTTDSPTDNVWTGKIGEDLETSAGGFSDGAELSTAAMAAAANYTCSTDDDTQPVYVCVHYHPFNQGAGGPSSDPEGLASGTLTLYTTAPEAPRLDSVSPGEDRLEAHWTEAEGGAEAVWFRVIAREAGSTTVVSTKDSQGTSGWVEGLRNGTTYDVTVQGLSNAGNPSAESNVQQGVPVPTNDFWERYGLAGGQEQGGCGNASGAVALLGAAAALARLGMRRRP
jgi:Fibronectin type III domain